MIELLSSIGPTLITGVVVLVAWMSVRKKIRLVETRHGKVQLGDAQGIALGYVLELVFESIDILKERDVLRNRRRQIIKRSIRQWRSQVAEHLRGHIIDAGLPAENLYRNQAYRYLMCVLDLAAGEMVSVAMSACERNGFDELAGEPDKQAYITVQLRDINSRITGTIEANYIVDEGDGLSQDTALAWISDHRTVTDAIWSDMYQQLISASLEKKAELLSYSERITAKGAAAGLSDAEIDNIRNRMQREIMEAI